MGEAIGNGILAAAAACTVLNGLALLWLLRKSLPAGLSRMLETIRAEHGAWAVDVEKMQRDTGAWKATLDGLIEEAENAFDRAERKRASAATQANRLQVPAAEAIPEIGTRAYKTWLRAQVPA